jgi:hypothetical protein
MMNSEHRQRRVPAGALSSKDGYGRWARVPRMHQALLLGAFQAVRVAILGVPPPPTRVAVMLLHREPISMFKDYI